MAVKSIIDVEINDSQFQRFKATWNKYQEELAKAPDAWKKLGAEVDDVLNSTAEGVDNVAASTDGLGEATSTILTGFEGIADIVSDLADKVDRLAKSETAASKAANNQATSWRDIAKSSKNFASHIKDSTVSILQWASITGLISGILGTGGLFGIERLASSASNSRRSSSGLGVTSGEQSAFNLNYSRLVDSPEHVLNGVNEALNDPSKRSSLYGAGFNESTLAGKNTAQISAELIPQLKKIADATDPRNNAAMLQARHLDQFISLQDFERLQRTPQSEVDQTYKAYQADKTGLNVDDKTNKAWQNLQLQLERSGTMIKNTFITGLAPLAPGIERLSKSFSGLVEALLKNPDMAKWIDEVGHGLDEFAGYIGTPEFKADVLSFTKGIGDMAKGLAAAVKWLVAHIPGLGTEDDKDSWHWDWNGGAPKAVPNTPGNDTAVPLWADTPENILKRAGNAAKGALGGDTSPASTNGVPDVVNGQNSTGQTIMHALRGGFDPVTGQQYREYQPRGIRNNNPLNLSYLPGQGAIGADNINGHHFGQYVSMEEGIAAEVRQMQILRDKYGLKTPRQIISKWAPARDGNDEAAYNKAIGDAGIMVDADTQMNPTTIARLVAIMAKHENSKDVDPEAIRRGVDMGLHSQATQRPVGRNPSTQITINNQTDTSVAINQLQ